MYLLDVSQYSVKTFNTRSSYTVIMFTNVFLRIMNSLLNISIAYKTFYLFHKFTSKMQSKIEINKVLKAREIQQNSKSTIKRSSRRANKAFRILCYICLKFSASVVSI